MLQNKLTKNNVFNKIARLENASVEKKSEAKRS